MVIAALPSLAGGDQTTDASVLPGVAEAACGAPGTVLGVAFAVAAGPSPIAFVATTLNEYSCPLVRPEKVQLRGFGVTPTLVVQDCPPGLAVTAYCVTGMPPFGASVKETSTFWSPGAAVTTLVPGVVAEPVQPGYLKFAIRVRQPVGLVVDRYSFVYQNVQSSRGSTFIDE